MTDITRGALCTDAGDTPPFDAIDYQNQLHADIVGLWDRVTCVLSSVSGADTITAASTPTIPAYTTGMSFWFQPASPNTTTTPTLNVDDRGAKTIVTASSEALDIGALDDSHLYLLFFDGTNLRVVFQSLSAGDSSAFPEGYIDGFITGNNATDAVNDIDIAAGVCRDSADERNLVGEAMTKQSDFAWVAGTNQGGMLMSDDLDGTIAVTNASTTITGTGTAFTTDFQVGHTITLSDGQCLKIKTIASDTSMTSEKASTATGSGLTYRRGGKASMTCYRILAIYKASDGSVDYAFSPVSVPTDLPAGYTHYRIIWHFLTGYTSSSILGYVQTAGDKAWLTTSAQISDQVDVSGLATTHNKSGTYTCIIPGNFLVYYCVTWSNSDTSNITTFNATLAIQPFFNSTLTDNLWIVSVTSPSLSSVEKVMVPVPLDSNSQMRIRISVSAISATGGGNDDAFHVRAFPHLMGWQWDRKTGG